MRELFSINPFTLEKFASFPLQDEASILKSIEYAFQAFQDYKNSDLNKRSYCMMNLANLLEENQDLYALFITQEMGKPINESRGEILKCAWLCRYYAEHSRTFIKDEIIETEAYKSYVTYRPLGVLLAVMPWNFPFWQVFRWAVPALMAGNTCILKHASNVPSCSKLIEQIFQKAGFPRHAFTNIHMDSKDVGLILKDPRVKSVSLTGSGPAGSSVASIAGQELKSSLLELGGNDAYIILEDADLRLAAKACRESRLLNAGQSCIGAKRIIVVNDIYDTFLEYFTKEMEQVKMGDPIGEGNLGPLARKSFQTDVHLQVTTSIKEGAHLHLGGYIPELKGAFYPPTILTNVQSGQLAYHEEIFGPVASIIKVRDEAEAIDVANDSIFGLGACVFTKDLAKGERIAKESLEAGSCFVNQFVKSDPRLPFGGIKQSGFGRELGREGIRSLCNIKTVYIK